MSRSLLFFSLFAVVAIAIACDKPKPPPETREPVLRATCDRPLPITLGVSMQGVGSSCYSFDALTNATLVLDAEVKPPDAVDIVVFDPATPDAAVCRASLTEANAAWGTPKSFICSGFRTTARHLLRVDGKGTFRFTLHPR